MGFGWGATGSLTAWGFGDIRGFGIWAFDTLGTLDLGDASALEVWGFGGRAVWVWASRVRRLGL